MCQEGQPSPIEGTDDSSNSKWNYIIRTAILISSTNTYPTTNFRVPEEQDVRGKNSTSFFRNMWTTQEIKRKTLWNCAETLQMVKTCLLFCSECNSNEQLALAQQSQWQDRLETFQCAWKQGGKVLITLQSMQWV